MLAVSHERKAVPSLSATALQWSGPVTAMRRHWARAREPAGVEVIGAGSLRSGWEKAVRRSEVSQSDHGDHAPSLMAAAAVERRESGERSESGVAGKSTARSGEAARERRETTVRTRVERRESETINGDAAEVEELGLVGGETDFDEGGADAGGGGVRERDVPDGFGWAGGFPDLGP